MILTSNGEALILASTSAPWPFLVPIGLVILIMALFANAHRLRLRRRAYIEAYTWPPGLIQQFTREHPNLSARDVTKIELGLRQFFVAYLYGRCRHVSMPSVAADELWHQFILYTREYDAFCRQAFGRFLHHRPAAVLAPAQKLNNEGLRRVWWQSCKLEGINPQAATALPLLFALDRDLKFPGGNIYHPDCEALRRQGVYGGQCGGDFSSTSFDGTTDGMGDGDGGSGDGGDGGGGCGGD